MMRRCVYFSFFLFGWLPLIVHGQLDVNVQEEFSDANPLVRVYETNGTPSMIYGKAFSTGDTPLASATKHIEDWRNLYGKEIGELVPQLNAEGEILNGVMPNAAGNFKFYTFRFNQEFEGLPVFRSGIGFLVRNSENNPLVLTGFDIKDFDGLEGIAGGVTEPDVTDAMLSNVEDLMDYSIQHLHEDHAPYDEEADQGRAAAVEEEDAETTFSVLDNSIAEPVSIASIGPTLNSELMNAVVQVAQTIPVIGEELTVQEPLEIEVSEEKLVIWAGINNVPEEPRLAVSFMAQRGSVLTYPHYDKYLVVADANTGEILLSETQIVGVDVEGTVSGRATDGFGSLECHPEVQFFLPYAEVEIVGGNSVFADQNGDFVIPHNGTSQVTVTSHLRGQWFEVFDIAAGNTTPAISLPTTPPGPVDFVHNPSLNNEFATANVNAYLESNICRDYVLSYEPSFPVIATQTSFNIFTNINDSCNAFYDGSSINFFRAGGGCNNTSFSDVVYHEYGHHLVNVTGNGQGQFGEGSGDIVGVLMQDDPILGHGFSGNCNNGIRNAANNLQYPCSGGIHFCGQLISGCVWSTRNELLNTEPANYRDISASLFFGMLIVRGQTQPGNSIIDPSITIIYLELDDDDDDIGNGTPHYDEIAAGFGAHNMDAPPLNFLGFEYPQGLPEMISPSGGVEFTVQINDLIEQHVPSTVTLHVDRGSGSFESFAMNPISAGLYEADFPASPCGTILKYYFSAETTGGSTETDPDGAPNSFHTALSADNVTTVFSDNFESDQGWLVIGNPADGDWQRGIPIGGGDRGDPAQDYDGSGRCFLTDNSDGNSDVDDGSTILVSPVFDGTTSGGDVLILSYSRWYSNHVGNAPEADVFEVEISNNAGATWTTVEVVGPAGEEVRGGWFRKQFRVSDFITPTTQMRVQFIASDLDAGSIVEAGLDAFEVSHASCSSRVSPDSYNVVRGEYESGELDDVDASDDVRLNFRSTDDRVKGAQIEFKGFSPLENPDKIELVVEASVDESAKGVLQGIEMFNYSQNRYETVDIRAIDQNDAVVLIKITRNHSDYVEPGTFCVKARVLYRTGKASTTFTMGVDELFWTIENN